MIAGEITLFGLEVDAERAGKAEQWRGQAGFDEEAAVLDDLANQRFGVGPGPIASPTSHRRKKYDDGVQRQERWPT